MAENMSDSDTSWTYRGMDVAFPFQPYPSQRLYTENVIDAIADMHNALLESPTGTGKTLALLCGSLAYLSAVRVSAKANQRGEGRPRTGRIVYASRTHSQLAQVVNQLKKLQSTTLNMSAVVLGSRDQLCLHPAVGQKTTSAEKTQCCNLLVKSRKCPYFNNYAAERDKKGFEVHARPLTESLAANKEPTEDFRQSKSVLSPADISDIEDLVSVGKSNKACPYFKARDVATTVADFVFMPYNYLLDPTIRSSTLFGQTASGRGGGSGGGSARPSGHPLLDDAVVILDEAHNVAKTCEDAMSLSFQVQDFALAIREVSTVVQLIDMRDKQAASAGADSGTRLQDINRVSGGIPLDAMALADLDGVLNACDVGLDDTLQAKEKLVDLEANLVRNIEAKWRPETGLDADCIIDWLNSVNLGDLASRMALSTVLQRMSDLMTGLASLTVSGHVSGQSWGSSRGMSMILSILKLVDGVSDNNLDVMAIMNDEDLDQTAVRTKLKSSYAMYITPCPKVRNNFVINLWCCRPSLAMQSLIKTGTRSVILASGTLSPLNAFAQELGIDFSIQFAADHVIDSSQVLVTGFSSVPNPKTKTAMVPLLSTYANRSKPEYLSSLGQTIHDVLVRVPSGGSLIFFPSYTLMQSCVTSWTESGLWDQLTKAKCCFIEPRDKETFNNVLAEYAKAVKMRISSGACLFAVLRGKIAEGIDFSDEMARAVLIVGLPYPNTFEPKIKMKMTHMDSIVRQSAKSGVRPMSGNEWYNLEAYRAVNQAIGRVIRHRHDFGSVVFLDRRLGDEALSRDSTVKRLISKWILQAFDLGAKGCPTDADYDQKLGRISSFFSGPHAKIRLPSSRSDMAFVKEGVKRKAEDNDERPSSSAVPPTDMYSRSKKRIVLNSKSVRAVTDSMQVQQQSESKRRDSATDLVVELKRNLTLAEMTQFRDLLKRYRVDGGNQLGPWVEMLCELRRLNKISEKHLDRLTDYVRQVDKGTFADLLKSGMC